MNEAVYRELIEASWQRRLTPAEEARLESWFVEHPASRLEWEAETALNQAVGRLRDVPLSSNFTALVMQAVDREETSAARRPSLFVRFERWLHRPASKLAWAALIFAATWFSYDRYQAHSQGQMARNLAAFVRISTELNEKLDPTLSPDFEAIQRLSQAQVQVDPIDDALFTVLSR